MYERRWYRAQASFARMLFLFKEENMSNFQKVKGTRDVFGEEVKRWQKIEQLIKELCFLYGYDEFRTPEFESTEVFKRENDSSDMVNKEMYTFMDQGNRSLTLRPEITAGIVRSVVENKLYANVDLPLKYYYIASNFRAENPQKGRYRIFHQFGVEAFGAKNPLLDLEVITIGATLLSILGIKESKVLINTLGDEESRNQYREALKEHFASSIDTMCADCKRRYIQNPLRILDCKIDKDHDAMQKIPKMSDYLTEASKLYFNQIIDGLKMLEIPYEIDEKLVRGLDYYTDTVFEVVSTNKDMGAQSTLFAGGRYDKLVEYFGGPEMSGIGFGLGLERLLIALEAESISLDDEDMIDVYVLCLDEKYQKEAFILTTLARANGYRTEMDYLGRSMKAQFKTVDRKKAQVVAILGEDEVRLGRVTLKYIPTQEQLSVGFDEMIAQLDAWATQEHQHEHNHECSCGHDHEDCDGEDCQCGHQH